MGVIATPIIRKLGHKTVFVAGGLTYVVFVASFILPSYASENPENTSWYLSKGFLEG